MNDQDFGEYKEHTSSRSGINCPSCGRELTLCIDKVEREIYWYSCDICRTTSSADEIDEYYAEDESDPDEPIDVIWQES